MPIKRLQGAASIQLTYPHHVGVRCKKLLSICSVPQANRTRTSQMKKIDEENIPGFQQALACPKNKSPACTILSDPRIMWVQEAKSPFSSQNSGTVTPVLALSLWSLSLYNFLPSCHTRWASLRISWCAARPLPQAGTFPKSPSDPNFGLLVQCSP